LATPAAAFGGVDLTGFLAAGFALTTGFFAGAFFTEGFDAAFLAGFVIVFFAVNLDPAFLAGDFFAAAIF
jgi:hypothetical protein